MWAAERVGLIPPLALSPIPCGGIRGADLPLHLVSKQRAATDRVANVRSSLFATGASWPSSSSLPGLPPTHMKRERVRARVQPPECNSKYPFSSCERLC